MALVKLHDHCSDFGSKYSNLMIGLCGTNCDTAVVKIQYMMYIRMQGKQRHNTCITEL